VPDDQIVVIHADLGDADWPETLAHIKANVVHKVNVVRSKKTFFEMVEHKFRTRPDVPSWPSPAHRQCTSDLKRGPIYKLIRNDMKARGATIGVNVMGIRAEESPNRAKMTAFRRNAAFDAKTIDRTVYDYFPIFEWTTEEVFDFIAQLGQEPHHAYALGNKRLSCAFCIMGCAGDLRNAAKQFPELAAKYIRLERMTGYSMFHKETLESKLKGIPINVEPVQRGLALESA
jgi:DNA sulfur modification protein DndC